MLGKSEPHVRRTWEGLMATLKIKRQTSPWEALEIYMKLPKRLLVVM